MDMGAYDGRDGGDDDGDPDDDGMPTPCENCEKMFDLGDGKPCRKCGVIFCADCARYVDGVGWRCLKCLPKDQESTEH